MWTTLIVCLGLTITLHADDIDKATPTSDPISTIDNDSLCFANTSSSSLIEQELDKIRTDCMTPQDFELLTDNAIRYHIVQIWSHVFVGISVTTIGLQELRNTLKLPALPHWTPLNRTNPSEHELESATTIEEYYNLREPRSRMRSLDSRFLFEHNVDTAITYLNKRLPSIQRMFKKAFEEVCPAAPTVLNKKAIDSMIKLFGDVDDNIQKETERMMRRDDCWDEKYY